MRKFSFVEVCGGITWVLMIAMGLWRHEYPGYMDVEVTFVAVEGDGGKWRQNEVFIHTHKKIMTHTLKHMYSFCVSFQCNLNFNN